MNLEQTLLLEMPSDLEYQWVSTLAEPYLSCDSHMTSGYGGPHAGFFAVRKEYTKNIPGRIVGETWYGCFIHIICDVEVEILSLDLFTCKTIEILYLCESTITYS